MSTTPQTAAKETTGPDVETQQQTDAAPKLVARKRARAAREGADIHLSEKAAEKVREIVTADNFPDTMYLYVGVKGGGCSGLQYVLDLRDETAAPIKDSDEVFESNGLVVVSDFKSYMVGNLSGTTIDYQESMMGAGFTFNNPNAKHSCGCGSSYSA
jgi:iron-sulfur cluster assembly protein